MKITNQTLSILIGLFLLGLLAVAGIYAIEYLNTLYSSLDPQVARTLVGVLIVVLLMSLIIARGVRKIIAHRMQLGLISERAATYRYFTDHWTGVMDQGHVSNNNAEAPQNLDRLMTLLGCAEAIKAHLALRTMMQDKDMPVTDMRTQFGKALLAIRKDLGTDSQGISAKDLQQLVMPETHTEERSNGLPKSTIESEPSSGA
jgi:hypothetical protein